MQVSRDEFVRAFVSINTYPEATEEYAGKVYDLLADNSPQGRASFLLSLDQVCRNMIRGGPDLRNVDPYYRDCLEQNIQDCSRCSCIECSRSPYRGLGIYSNGTELVIAKNSEDARILAAEQAGTTTESVDEFGPVPMLVDAALALEAREGGYQVIRMVRRWIAEEGRGYLYSFLRFEEE